MKKIKLLSVALAIGIAFSTMSDVNAASKWNDIGAVKKNGRYIHTTEVTRIVKDFNGIKFPHGAFSKPSFDADKKAIKEYIKYRTMDIGRSIINESYVHEMTMGMKGFYWGETGLSLHRLDDDLFKRRGEFPMENNTFTKDWDKLVELKKYARVLGNEELYQYYNQTLYLYSLAKKHNDYLFYQIGKKRLVVLDNALRY